MRLLIWLVLVVACLDAGSAVAAQDTAESAPKMAQYFVGLIYRGPTWSPEVTQKVQSCRLLTLQTSTALSKVGRWCWPGRLQMKVTCEDCFSTTLRLWKRLKR